MRAEVDFSNNMGDWARAPISAGTIGAQVGDLNYCQVLHDQFSEHINSSRECIRRNLAAPISNALKHAFNRGLLTERRYL